MEYKDRLFTARKMARLTQKQLGEAVGMTQASISDLESGKSASTAFNARIAEACRVSSLWLETGRGDVRTAPINAEQVSEPSAITARDLFAIEAMQIVAPRHTNHDDLARDAYALADAMLRARKAQPQ